MSETNLTTEQHDERREYVQGLRELAAFLEAHPALPLPFACAQNAFVNDKAALASVAKCGGKWEKDASPDYFYIRKAFPGGLSYDVVISREAVCRKVRTGTRIEPAKPEQEVETFEWVCDEPLLAGVK